MAGLSSQLRRIISTGANYDDPHNVTKGTFVEIPMLILKEMKVISYQEIWSAHINIPVIC